METTTNPNTEKCNNCSKNCVEDEAALCPLCKVVPYCSEKCTADSFESHRASCLVKVRLLGLQHLCTVCDKDARPSSHVCKSCAGIKYCSAKCKQANASELKLTCGPYANMSPRPCKDHRLTLLFPVDKEKPCFVWLHCPDADTRYTSDKKLVSPSGDIVETLTPILYGPVAKDQQHRRSVLRNTAHACLKRKLGKNVSLGKATTGRPSDYMNGNLAIWSTIDGPNGGQPSDANPSDLPKVVQLFKQKAENERQVPSTPEEFVGNMFTKFLGSLADRH